MTIEIPQYGLRAYALLFSKHGTNEPFKQSALDWIVSQSMKKKIFAVLLRCGWIQKKTTATYVCTNPSDAVQGLLDFRVPDIIKNATKPYAFTQLSAIEIWSDFSYVQRSREKSPYFIKILQKDLKYWTQFLNNHEIPNYIRAGTTIGEYIILIPVKNVLSKMENNVSVEPLSETLEYAKANDIFAYPVKYMEKKYGKK